MGYRINYGMQVKQFRNKKMRLPVLTVLSFLLFLFFVNSMWPESAEYIQNSAVRCRMKVVAVLNSVEADMLQREPLDSVFSEQSSFISDDSK